MSFAKAISRDTCENTFKIINIYSKAMWILTLKKGSLPLCRGLLDFSPTCISVPFLWPCCSHGICPSGRLKGICPSGRLAGPQRSSNSGCPTEGLKGRMRTWNKTSSCSATAGSGYLFPMARARKEVIFSLCFYPLHTLSDLGLTHLQIGIFLWKQQVRSVPFVTQSTSTKSDTVAFARIWSF